MLHKDPFLIHPDTLRLIQDLQLIPEMKDFYLVGGTALALQLGHRNSIDIDLFTKNEFEPASIISLLADKFEFRSDNQFTGTLLCHISNIKVDFISHPYALVREPITKEGITYLSKEDIAAMKFNAIIRSGQRLKDFIDLYYLLEYFTIHQMVHFFSIKYPNSNSLIALKAIGYFDDIEPAIDPPKMKTKLPLSKIKKRIIDALLHKDKVFS